MRENATRRSTSPSPRDPVAPGTAHKAWHSRGYLPHFDCPEVIQGVTFRLHDAVPREVLDRWKAELGYRRGLPAEDPAAKELRRRIARFEDRGRGSCWLARPEIARLVEDALLHFDAERYRLLAWCVMPNHVHALIEQWRGFSLGGVVHSWKSFTAKQANAVLGRRGEFWMADYFDRYIRDARHYAAAIEYIERNPVEAGLGLIPEQWEFSSARRRVGGPAGVVPSRRVSMKPSE